MVSARVPVERINVGLGDDNATANFSISARQAGIGSAVNNALSRIARLVAIALLGVIVGGELDLEGFRRGLVVTAVLLIAGGLVSAIGIRNAPAAGGADGSGEEIRAGGGQEDDVHDRGGDDQPEKQA